jgi:hypothetical protein
VDVAKGVIAYLCNLRWDVYQEVQLSYSSPCADIVAVQNGIVWVVETKASRTLTVIEQAIYWRRYAHKVSVGVPYSRRGSMWEEILAWKGVGCLEVSGKSAESIRESVRPKLIRNASTDFLKSKLCDEHKTFAEAGNPHGHRWTPFQKTAQALQRYVASRQIVDGKKVGVLLKKAIESVDHHYSSNSSAKQSMKKWIEEGVIEGLTIQKVDRTWRVFHDNPHNF